MVSAKSRKLRYTGVVETDSIFVSNHGNVSMFMNGTFNASGMIYCPKYTVCLELTGSGLVSFHGVCQRMEIRIKGNCVLDLTQMDVGEAWCEAHDATKIVTGPTKVISKVELHDSAILVLTQKTLVIHAIKLGTSRIEGLQYPQRECVNS